jgi:hypothetical protein
VIDDIRPHEDLQVPDEVTDDEDEQGTAGDGHDVFLPEGRIPDSRKKIHQVRRVTNGSNLTDAGARASTHSKDNSRVR